MKNVDSGISELILLQTTTDSPMSPPPISTNVPPAQYGLENATPRAQTMREIEAMKDDKSRLRSSSSSSLEGMCR